MQQERKPRSVRMDDFVAETLEAEADKMPPWTKFQADIWRDVAKDLRASESPKWCESGKNQNRSQSLPLCDNELGATAAADVTTVALNGLSLYRVIP